MSIFSRLRRRGEDGNSAESPPNAQPSAPAPKSPPSTSAAPPARATEPAKPPVNGAEPPRPAPPPREQPREQPVKVTAPVAPPRGNVQSPVAGAIGTQGAIPSAPIPPSRAPIANARPAVAKAPFPAPAPIAPAPAPAAPVPVTEDAGGSLDLAIAQALENSSVRRVAAAQVAASAPPPPQAHGRSTASDDAALRETFEALAVAHVTPIRNAMMEVRFGEAQASWLELGRPALKSLRSMASEVGHEALVAAVDGFVGALQNVLEPGKPPEVTGPSRETLLAAYAPLATCLPRAFALEGERDRREPIVVRALLEQVSELEPLMIDKLIAAGLGTLAQLFAAKADEIAAVTGIPGAIAAAVAARIEAFRRSTPAALASVDPAATVRELVKLLEQLRTESAAFDQAARGWTPDDRRAKKQLRQQRQTTFLQITIALVRLGEIDFALRLPKFPFARRIEDLDRVVTSRAAAIRSQPAPAPETAAAPERVVAVADDAEGLSGPHPAAA